MRHLERARSTGDRGTRPSARSGTASAARAPAWRALRPVVLRMAGFPFDWLDDLAAPAAAAAATAVVRARGEIGDLAARAGAALRASPPPSRADRLALDALRSGRVPGARARRAASPAIVALAAELDDVVRRAEDARRALADVYDREREGTAARLVDRFRATPALRDMLLVSNERSYGALTRWLDRVDATAADRRSADRKNVDTLVRYLQRVCAKNDTTSHFGPFVPGLLDHGHVGISWRAGTLQRFPMLSPWAANAIASSMSDDAAAARRARPRRTPGAVLDGTSVSVVDLDYSRKRVDDVRDALRVSEPRCLDPRDAILLRLCDGEASTGEIARAASGLVEGWHPPEAEVVERLRALERDGLVVIGPEVPYGVEDPIPALRAHAGEQSAARDLLEACRRDLARFATGDTDARRGALDDLKARFSTATERSATRSHGSFYGDRTVLNEQCVGWFEDLRVGAPVARALEDDLGLVYDLLLLRPRRRLAAERKVLARWFDGRFGDRAEVRIDDYLRAFVADVDVLERDYEAVDREIAMLDEETARVLLPRDERDVHVHAVDPEAVRALVAEHGSALPAVCNPDVMLLAPSAEALARGDFRVLVGEVHATEENLSHGSFAPYVERVAPGYTHDVVRGYEALIDDDEEIVDVTQLHRNRTWIRSPLPCRDVEAVGRSSHPRHLVTPLHELTVRRTDAGLRLRAPGVRRHLRLIVAPLAWLGVRRNPLSVFSFPWTLGGLAIGDDRALHTPRIEMGNVILQRELWRVPSDRLVDEDKLEGFVRAQRLRHELRLPRRVFVRFPAQPKPVFCDFDSPLLVRQLTRMAASGGGTAEISELLPGPGDLWVRDARGAYTSELRCAVFTNGGRK